MDGGSSPHTRGALQARHMPVKRLRIIPAYAGSTRRASRRRRGFRDHPRIRGEHRLFTEYERRGGGSSPHTRGARAFLGEGDMSGRIIPAYAGSTSAPTACRSTSADHPRIRGEHQYTSYRVWFSGGSSPHTRGARVGKLGLSVPSGIIPAYAGSTC